MYIKLSIRPIASALRKISPWGNVKLLTFLNQKATPSGVVF